MTTPEATERKPADAADLTRVIELMVTDKSNDWSEEIAVLVDMERQLLGLQVAVTNLGGTIDGPDWLRTGPILDDHVVAYIRSIVVPASPTPPLDGSDG